MLRTIVAAAVIVGVVAGCGGDIHEGGTLDDIATPVPTVTEAGGVPSESPNTGESAAEIPDDVTRAGYAIADLVAALVDTNPETLRTALESTEQDSLAYHYLAHRANLYEAALDGGQLLWPPRTVAEIEDGFRLCDTVDATVCTDLTWFEWSDAGVTEFLVDGERLEGRLSAGDTSTVTSGTVTAEFLTSYLSIQSDALFVTMRVSSGDAPAELMTHAATYRSPDGGQRRVADFYGPMALGPASSATVALAFPGVEPGGSVTIDVAEAGYVNDEGLTVPVGPQKG